MSRGKEDSGPGGSGVRRGLLRVRWGGAATDAAIWSFLRPPCVLLCWLWVSKVCRVNASLSRRFFVQSDLFLPVDLTPRVPLLRAPVLHPPSGGWGAGWERARPTSPQAQQPVGSKEPFPRTGTSVRSLEQGQ